ncbi:winged helix-turn-helix transcriptional regulator [Nitratifractor salsuginis]|uniref:Transcriptional regulator, HxlR family n=1 Tax=Nitratifractor salsuginis (strain DSM 16511 / JCM 12458 / E9I37-1) TaxID=749222 RepID=E6X2B9_NITSE|nr:helix-turn-helix domain-containing protein [Nitratifractor salsuginis]ADV46054.1 transcriptional regulator, HxlR family [Nitratifractor salsuginis DSM 16511]
MEQQKEFICPFEYALEILSGKWKGLVLFYLGRRGTLRYSQLRRELKGITQKMLTQTLRRLEEEGLIHREVYPVVPPKVEYSLTPKGQSLLPILDALQKWGDEQLRDKAESDL